MKQLLFLFFFINACLSLHAQQDHYDQLKTKYDSLRKAENHEGALVVAKQMNTWALQNETDTSLRYAVSKGFVGEAFYLRGDLDSAIIELELSIKLLVNNQITEKYDLIKNLGLIVSVLRTSYDFDKLENYLLQLIGEYEEIGDFNSSFNCVYNLSILYKDFGMFDLAISSLKDAININEIRINSNPFNQGLCFLRLSEVYCENDDFISSLDYCRKSFQIFKVDFNSNLDQILNVYNQFGLTNIEMGNLDSAEFYLKNMESILENSSSSFDYKSSCYHNLGLMFWLKGNYMMAKRYYLTAIELDELNGQESDITYLNLSLLYTEMGDFKESERFLLKALKLNQEYYKDINPTYAIILRNLSGHYFTMGDYKKAELYLNQSLTAYETMKLFNLDYLKANTSLGVNYQNLGYYEKAQIFLIEAREKIKQKLGLFHPDYAAVLNLLGKNCLFLANYNEAEELFKSSLNICSNSFEENNSNFAECYHNLGNLYYLKGEYDVARKNYLISYEIMKKIFPDGHYNTSIAAEDLAYISILTKDFKAADSLMTKAMSIRNNYVSYDFSFLTTSEKAIYWEKEKDFYEIINSYSVSALDSLPSFTHLTYNANLISKSLLLGSSRELDNAISESSDEQLKSQFAGMKQLRRIYSKMQSEGSENKEIMERYKTQADSLDKILVNKLGEYAASKRKFEITWRDVQSNLTTTDAAIEFARYYDDKDSLYKYMALVVRPDYEYPELVSLGEEDAIRTAVENKDFSTLYNEVWKGIDSLLVGIKRVYYSPAGELNNVSFSALCIEEGSELVASNKEKKRGVVIGNNKTTTKACNTGLMDKYELHQLTTTRYLADGTLKKEKPIQPSLVLVGGINFDDIPEQTKEADKEQSNEDFAFHANLNKQSASSNGKKRGKRSSSNYGKRMEPLPGTKEEIVNISGLLNTSNWKVQTKSDKKAGEYEFKKELETKAPGVLHIATHGFAFPDEAKKESKLLDMNQTSTYKVSEDPMVRCGLMLGGSNISWTGNPQKMIEQTGDDGILTAAEVANLDLSNTKLVVLSACETGLGKIEGSEGTFGLKRGFKLAGVEQIIVSLWSVPDKETMELMTLFYSDLTKSLNPVTSFEKAQKEMRNKYPTDPEKWAGFVLVR